MTVNANNRFAVLLWGMKAKDWKVFDKLVQEAIREGYLSEGYTEEQVDIYFSKAGEVILTRTHGKRPVADMNKMIF